MRYTVLVALLQMVGAAAMSAQQIQQIQDPTFRVETGAPVYSTGGPRVGFDEARQNVFRLDGRMENWARLLRADGYVVEPIREPATLRTLARFAIYVIATPRRASDTGASSITSEEVETIFRWVQDGGSLLVLGDHYPFDAELDILTQRFEVRFSYGVVGDSANYDRTSANPSIRLGRVADQWIVYTRENGLLQSHPVTEGRTPEEQIRRVLTFGGSSIRGPEGSTSFLRLSPTATNRQRAGFRPEGLGTAQGIAMQVGRGRVVVMGDATMFTAQVVREEREAEFKLGMGRSDFDNRQLALNVMHWLSRAY